uniref:hypothetical protein n=1 Tax=Nonomuraea sp. CA-251285 TaxID=3240002 RepID=UPI003F49072D
MATLDEFDIFGGATSPVAENAQAASGASKGAESTGDTETQESARQDQAQGRTGGGGEMGETPVKESSTKSRTEDHAGNSRRAGGRGKAKQPAPTPASAPPRGSDRPDRWYNFAPPVAQEAIDPDEERHLLVVLGQDAGRAAAAIRKADEYFADYVKTLAKVRAAGISERKILGEVARFDVNIPAPE